MAQAEAELLEVPGALVRRDGALMVGAGEITPEEFARQIEREQKLRDLLLKHVRDNMVLDHHYYYLRDEDKDDPKKKPGLKKEGALNLCSLFKVVPLPDPAEYTMLPDKHAIIRVRVNIFNSAGAIVARADGMCSTLESKYDQQERWVGRKKVPAGIDLSTLKQRQADSKFKDGPPTYTQYLLETTSNPADHYNTVLQMATKRATVQASGALPLASELFIFGLEPDEEETRTHAAVDAARREDPAEPQRRAAPLPEPTPEMIDSVKRIDSGVYEVRDHGYIQTVRRLKTSTMCSCGADTKRTPRCVHIVAVSRWAARPQDPDGAKEPNGNGQAQEPEPEPVESTLPLMWAELEALGIHEAELYRKVYETTGGTTISSMTDEQIEKVTKVFSVWLDSVKNPHSARSID